MSDIRVLIVDDQEIYRSALSDLLDVVDGFAVVAQAASREKAIARARASGPDLVLMDLRLPGIDGWTATHVIQSRTVPPG